MHDGYDPNNLFALIVEGRKPCVRVFDDDVALAFMDTFPQSDGHTLVIPKGVAAPNFLQMPGVTVGPFMERVHRVARAITASLKPDGLCLMQLNGAAAGQTVFYPHVHLIPHWRGSPIYPHGSAPPVPLAQLQAIAGQIRSAF